jgi:hypothetical protein
MKLSAQEAQKWFRDQIRKLADPTGMYLMASHKERLRTVAQIDRYNTRYLGRMIMFFYDPYHKNNPKVLPYYDMFPLVIPFNLNAPSKKNGPGFLGLNLHYIPIPLRAQLLQQLMSLYQNQHLDENKKLQLSWQIIKSHASIKYYKPCVKWYLHKQVRSRIFIVDPLDWEFMLTLPTERFVRNTKSGVWRESKRSLGVR